MQKFYKYSLQIMAVFSLLAAIFKIIGVVTLLSNSPVLKETSWFVIEFIYVVVFIILATGLFLVSKK